MKSRILPLFLVGSATLFGAPSLDSLKIDLDQFSHKLNCQKGDIDLIHDKIATLTSSIDSFREEIQKQSRPDSENAKLGLEKRLSTLEGNHKTLVSDLKILKEHYNKSSEQLTALDKQMNADMKALKSSLQSMIALLQKDLPASSSGNVYVVQPGDSLGKIAQDHKTSIRRLKELNELSSETIRAGQKLQIPQ